MSAGSFQTTKYESDTGDIHLITVQPETVAATFGGTANAAPSDAITSPFAAEVNRGARAYGLRPRKVNVSFEDDAPEGYRPYTTLQLVVLQESVFSGIGVGDAVVYAGGTGEVTSKVSENIRPGEAVVGSGGESEPEPGA
jgi:hypothetical protein